MLSHQNRTSIICNMIPKIVLAPLAGVSDLAFRIISRQFGAKYCFYEMFDANAMVYEHPRNGRLLINHPKDGTSAAQLVGSDPSIMLEAANKLIAMANVTHIDINAACPAGKIIRKGAGADLLRHPDRLGTIVRKLSKSLKIPITVKLRSGFNTIDIKVLLETARICEDSGASIVFLHGRTMLQGYSGTVDYESIRNVKDALNIPLYASGDVLSPILAKKMFQETGCDGILVARGAMGNPWIFNEIQNYITKGTLPKKRPLWIRKHVLKRHLSLIMKYKDIPTSTMIGVMGKITMWYLKGLPHAKKLREKISHAKSHKSILHLIDTA